MPSSSKAGGPGDEKHLVCVTGAGSFIGSWVVKELLDRGYHVRGTARDPAHRKNAHLLELDGAEERLTLCRADVLDYGGLRAAFQGCRGVFHVASPVSNDPVSRAGGRGGDEERDQRGGRRGRAARGVHLLLRRRAHGPQPEPGDGRRRGVLERLRVLQTNREHVLLWQDDGRDRGDGGGGQEGPGAGGGGAGADGGAAASADGQLQHRPRRPVPDGRQEGLHERGHRLHRRPRRRPRARPRVRAPRLAGPPLPLRRRRAAPRPVPPVAPGPFPELPRHRQVRRRWQADGEPVQVLEPEAQGLGPGVHSHKEKYVRHSDIPAAQGTHTPACSGAKACTFVNHVTQQRVRWPAEAGVLSAKLATWIRVSDTAVCCS